MLKVGKRDFMLRVSKYLKRVENRGEEIVITHQNRPTLKLVPIRPKTIKDLRGFIRQLRTREDINKPVLPGLDKW